MKALCNTIRCLNFDEWHASINLVCLFSATTIFEYLFQAHKSYTMRYFFCEALCLVNIVLQLYLMNNFFDGEFFTYGLRVMNFSDDLQEDRFDPMVYVFPRVTKCTFRMYGPSGTLQVKDSICILPLNIVNEKTYIFLW